ncbi:carrier protein [Thecamonas trahens ATCC 50062]|uniref:Carrier protein n=1 Tax=Thecamonas trahens ATCC 50062 TaxID=461836 RepID=A0A0L0D3U6_THETB|nr:carrier protein [Thecamonas trahens ATCC 50062]KNC46910.1 carrier protein [Thecamonas trahens ATCC 50062]|eukprot:XP_013760183.1 carrier protein [Thecamonas trahens ATCC 50062]
MEEEAKGIQERETPILKHVNALLTVHGLPRHPRAELKRVLAAYDLNTDGALDASELRLLVHDMYAVAIAEAADKGAPEWYLRKARKALESSRGESAVAAAVHELLDLQAAHGGVLDWDAFVDTLEQQSTESAIRRSKYWRLAPICDIKIVLDDFVDPYRKVKIFVAGGMAGAVSKTVGAPLSRVTILRQTATQRGVASQPSVAAMVRDIWAREGLRGLFRGNGLDVLRSIPSQGITWLAYDVFKSLLREYDTSDSQSASRFAAGGLAGCVAILTTYPLDLMRTRIVCSTSSAAGAEPSVVGELLRVARSQGPLALYRGAGIACLEKGPSLAISLGMADVLSTKLRAAGAPDSMLTSLASGVAAGALASSATYPADLVMKNLQLDGAAGSTRQYLGVGDCITKLFLRSGIRGFYRGLSAQLMKSMPMAGASFGVYSQARSWLGLYHVPDA